MERAAIFVGTEDSQAAIELCRSACRKKGWIVDESRIAVFDPDHPDQGLPVVLFTSVTDPVTVLVVPTMGELAEGLWDSVYHAKPKVKGRSKRMVAQGIGSIECLFSALKGGGIRVYVVLDDSTIEPDEMLRHARDVFGPLMEYAAESDADESRAIREGQSRAWSEGRRVGRPPSRRGPPGIDPD